MKNAIAGSSARNLHNHNHLTIINVSRYSIMDNVITFIHRMVDKDVRSGTTDVYGVMFGCQFIIFLIILFSWSAFAEAEVRIVH